MHVDYIIVGQGIAGTILAQTLLQHNKKIAVVDDWNYSSSSKVAAGLYNPIVFKRLTKSWMADELVPFTEDFYSEMGITLGETFLHKQPIVKLFSNKEEQEFWMKQSQKTELKAFLSDKIKINFPEYINGIEGGCEIKRSGYVDVKKMLILFRTLLEKNNSLIPQRFDYSRLMIRSDFVQYEGVQAAKLIFCEGHKTSQNPFFNFVSLKPAKGEVLTIQTTTPLFYGKEEHSISKGIFILPLGNNTYKVGATYEWKELNEVPTESAKKEIIDKLEKIISVPFEIIKHEAGIRPAAIDRRPIIGLHPSHKTLGIFNGLGTKGIMLAPYWSKQFVNYLDGKMILPDEVNVNRLT